MEEEELVGGEIDDRRVNGGGVMGCGFDETSSGSK